MGKIVKETIHANGIDIGIYTQDFENEFISLTDTARYKRWQVFAGELDGKINMNRYPYLYNNTRRIRNEVCKLRKIRFNSIPHLYGMHGIWR
ncbi:MAG: hypothetical protein PHY47_14870 [Lachnospiraceae bacterium]|nr:hypothetical protein [Lachnospiraceae bacterium]